jgi:transcriptional regulator with XRE-family HTH domain
MLMSTLMSKVFSERLRVARELRKLSQAELAKAADLQPSAISHFETAGRSPSFDNLKRLADALKVTTDFLIGRSDEPSLSSDATGRLFRHAEKLSSADLEMLEQMAATLANRSKPQK